jgi:hypothetical protein
VDVGEGHSGAPDAAAATLVASITRTSY